MCIVAPANEHACRAGRHHAHFVSDCLPAAPQSSERSLPLSYVSDDALHKGPIILWMFDAQLRCCCCAQTYLFTKIVPVVVVSR